MTDPMIGEDNKKHFLITTKTHFWDPDLKDFKKIPQEQK